jgi:large subunit ribosomal protein L13Ae
MLLQVGWKHEKAVAELEAKRLAKAGKYYETKKKLIALRNKAEAQVKA